MFTKDLVTCTNRHLPSRSRASCLAFALYLVFMQWFLKDYKGQTVMLYVVATITVFTSGLWVLQGAEWQPVRWQAWLGIGALVLFSTYIGQLALFAAVRHLGSGRIALLSTLSRITLS